MEDIRTQNGFTLIELQVVVLIVGILAAVAVPQYNKVIWKSRAAHLESILSSLVHASDVYHLQTGEYAGYFDQLDIDFNLPTGQAICGRNWVPYGVKKGDGFEISIYTGGISHRYIVGVFFTEGRYKCTGFVHVLREKESAPSQYDGKSFCAEDYYDRACGTNCDHGDFCKKIMGKTVSNYLPTVYLYE